MEKKRAVLYCRVARDDAFSLKSQAQELRRYADRNGYTIVGVMSESGSGLTLNRPALSEVTKAICEGEVDVVLVKNLSRIGRNLGMVQAYINLLNEHKVTLLCVTERLEISDHNLYPFTRSKRKQKAGCSYGIFKCYKNTRNGAGGGT